MDLDYEVSVAGVKNDDNIGVNLLLSILVLSALKLLIYISFCFRIVGDTRVGFSIMSLVIKVVYF